MGYFLVEMDEFCANLVESHYEAMFCFEWNNNTVCHGDGRWRYNHQSSFWLVLIDGNG